MKRWEYKNYDEYISEQVKANLRKRDTHQTAREYDIIGPISKTIYDLRGDPSEILCHGVRTGAEIEMFRKVFASAYLFGTDLVAPDVPEGIEHDFNKPREAFFDRFDVVYSNSFDHAYDPVETFRLWINQLKVGGLLLIETNDRNEHVTASESCGMTMRDWMSFAYVYPKAKIVDMIMLDPSPMQKYRVCFVFTRAG